MTAAKRNLYIEQGATFNLAFTWNEGTSDAIGAPVDLTGCKARMQVRAKQQSPVIVDASSDSESPAILLGGDTGTIEVTLTAEMTDLLSVKSGLYDLEVEFPDGTVYRLLEGSVTVSPNITQDPDDATIA
jgi:hypothetical protein